MTEISNRELLELSARAVGVVWVDECFDYDDMNRMMVDFGRGTREWNPLKNNADAFDMVVRLRLMLSMHEPEEARVIWWRDGVRGEVVERWIEAHDSLACTRFAIVRAGAEIGRNTP